LPIREESTVLSFSLRLLALPVAKAFWRSAFSTCFGGLLGKREMIRLTALQIILQRGIERRFEGGQQLRNDDLLVEYMPGRSDAEEIAEAIMRVCAARSRRAKVAIPRFSIGVNSLRRLD
jgi:hypothetical protein